MKKGFSRLLVALLGVPLVGAALVGCGEEKEQQTQESAYTAVRIDNKDALTADWPAKSANRFVTSILITKDGGEEQDLIALMNGNLVVTSSDSTVISVSNNNEIAALKEGDATITVTLDGKYTDSVAIHVSPFEDPIKNKPVMVTTPVAGKEYKLGIQQYGLKTPSMIYFSTTKLNGYYWPTTKDFNASLNVVLEEVSGATGDYKYALKVVEDGATKYMGVAPDSTTEHVNDTVETSPTTKYKWDAAHNTLLTNVEVEQKSSNSKPSGDYYLGTYDDKETFSFSYAAEKIDKDNSYVAHLYEIPEVLTVTNDEITLLNGVHEEEQINVQKPQGTVTYTVTQGEGFVEVSATGLVTAKANGTAVIEVSDGVTTVEVVVVVRDAAAGETIDHPMTVAEAITAAKKLDGSQNEVSEKAYYIEGIAASNPSDDYAEFKFNDGTNDLVMYGGLKTIDGSGKYGSKNNGEMPGFYAGDTVKVLAQLENYKGTTYEIINTQLVSFTNNDVNVTTEGENATVDFTSGVTNNKAKNGSTITFTVTPANGYEVVSVSVAGKTLTPSSGSYSCVVKGTTHVVVVTKVAGAADKEGAVYTITGTSKDMSCLSKPNADPAIITSITFGTNSYVGNQTGGNKDKGTDFTLTNTLKFGKSNAGGSLTLGLDATKKFTKIKLTGWAWSSTATFKVNSTDCKFATVASKDTANTPETIEVNISYGVTELVFSNEYSSGNHACVIQQIEFVA